MIAAGESLHLSAHKYKEEDISQGCAICCFDFAVLQMVQNSAPCQEKLSLSDISSFPN